MTVQEILLPLFVEVILTFLLLFALLPLRAGDYKSGVATDGTSIWVANDASAGALAQFSYSSTAPLSPIAGFGSLSSPTGVAVDASGSVWTTNSGSNTVSKFIGLAAPVTTPLAATVGP